MAPIRRYLRVTKYSVLEVRIYLENPGIADSWLLRPGDPALPRIIQAIRPLVLPKLREDRERAQSKSKSKAKKNVKDVVVKDDFEVSIFLKDVSTGHSLLTKQKTFKEKARIRSNSAKLTAALGGLSGTENEPIAITDPAEDVVIRSEDDEDERQIDLTKISDVSEVPSAARESSSEEEDEVSEVASGPSRRRMRRRAAGSTSAQNLGKGEDDDDRKEKLALNTSYDGFAIYGRILCLIVKRRTTKTANAGGAGSSNATSSQQLLETWVSTQAQQDEEEPI